MTATKRTINRTGVRRPPDGPTARRARLVARSRADSMRQANDFKLSVATAAEGRTTSPLHARMKQHGRAATLHRARRSSGVPPQGCATAAQDATFASAKRIDRSTFSSSLICTAVWARAAAASRLETSQKIVQVWAKRSADSRVPALRRKRARSIPGARVQPMGRASNAVQPEEISMSGSGPTIQNGAVTATAMQSSCSDRRS